MRRTSDSSEKLKRTRAPATSPEGRENQMSALAEALSEKRMREGTASSQEILYWIKAGSERERLERDKLRSEVQKLQAQKEALDSGKRIEALYSDAMKAVKTYRGERDDDDD